ncbi:alkaline phosphatase family protein [Kribbella sp. NBC_01505]|uniref:alkaline phosphatase family protein n=1 Tax=Kribbella sp. NBC_01505 TaxID=2903580 RepID=UPI0038637FE0
MTLVIFIDGIGQDAAHDAGLDTLFDSARSLRTGIGYTVNIITEVFAGLGPDAAGFFNKWGLAPDRAPLGRHPRLARWLDPLERFPAADLWVRRKLRQRGVDTARIPWRMCPYFGKIGTDVAHGPNTPRSIFADAPVFLAHPHGLPGRDHDATVIEQARQALRDKRDVVLFLTYLDGLGHDFGPDSSQYRRRASWYRDQIAGLIDVGQEADPGSAVVLFSDHSMTPVTQHCRPPRFPRDVLAFVDATMIRLWAARGGDERCAEAAQALAATGSGQLLSEADRRAFGVTDPRWGDHIFVLDPGGLFVPDYFTGIHRPADSTARGMHGYHPDHEETAGIFYTLGTPAAPATKVLDPAGAHDEIKLALGGLR